MGSKEDTLLFLLVHFRHRSDPGLPRNIRYRSMLYLGGGECTNHTDYLRSGCTGLSPPVVYPIILAEYETNKGNLRPRHHAYAFDFYSRVVQGYPIFISGPLLEYPLRERMMNLRTNENKRITLLELTE